MKIDVACRVERGIRETNDDRALIMGQTLNCERLHGEQELPAVAVVCDGCGGYAGGGMAAQTVLETINEALPEILADPAQLAAVLDKARLAIYAKKEEYPEFAAMCTTVAGCVFCEDKTIVFHAGDSRIYRFDGTYLAKMTVDHSVVQDMVDMGRMTEEEARLSPQRNTITRCIGVECLPPEIYVSNSPIGPGETFLICSDGFWEVFTLQETRELLAEQGLPEERAERLVDRALEAGSDDNVTVCLCSCRGGGEVRQKTAFVLD